jgi:Na+-translocating ferredoxin:NAD+ oxidoreductase RnfA subunit
MNYVLLIISVALIKYFVQVWFLGICLFSRQIDISILLTALFSYIEK